MRFGLNSTGRRNITGLFWVTLSVLLLISVESYASAFLDRVVAVVNKEVITWSELYRAMEFDLSGGAKSLSEDEKKKFFKENEANFLENMIDMKLQIQTAKKLDIEASKADVSDAIESIKKKYSMDEKEFEESLKKEGFNMEEYKKRLAEQIVLSKVVGQQVRNKIVISDEEIKEYMAKNKSIQYRVREIFLKKPEKDTDRNAVETKAGELLQRLKTGEDFSQLALKYSDDSSGKIGGDLGFIKKEDLGKQFLDIISSMVVGDVSAPFWTERGLHILKLDEKVDAGNMKEFIEIAKKKLFDKRFSEEYRSWIRSLREKAYVEVRL